MNRAVFILGTDAYQRVQHARVTGHVCGVPSILCFLATTNELVVVRGIRRDAVIGPVTAERAVTLLALWQACGDRGVLPSGGGSA